jgi:LmbE family N-acetylglucosaminyl deacetylase
MVVAPHPDDESIGCGGAICLHAARGNRVVVVFLTSGELGLKDLPREGAWRVREREAEAAADVLGVSALTFLRRPDWFLTDGVAETASLLRPVLEREAPQVIYVPHEGEGHPDHQASPGILRAALADATTPRPTLLGYEVWTPLSDWDRAEDVTEVIRRKMQAVRCYRSQLRQFRYDRAIRGLNQYRGILGAGCRYAEVFRSLRANDGKE